jgi:hypothetical protein
MKEFSECAASIFDFRFAIFDFDLRFVRNKNLKSKIKNLKCLLAFWICSILLVISPVAEPSSSIRGAFLLSGFGTGVGTRAMGMNGAFAAVSDDSSSAYWNPAGLTSSWCKELSFTRANLYDLDLITSNALNISAPETGAGAISFGWTRLEYDFESWREEVFLISYAKNILGKARPRVRRGKQGSGLSSSFLSFGVVLKYLRQTSDLELAFDTENAGASSSAPIFCEAKGMGLDVGLFARIANAKDGRNRFSIGIAAQDIPTVVKWNSDSDFETEEYMPYRYKAGCSFEPLPRLTVALDLVGEQNVTLKEVHFGVEHWILPMKRSFPISEKNLAIRGGVAKQLSASERMTFAGGLGIRWAAWQLDYAYLMDNNGLGDTRNRFSVSVRF